jgi:hypothetical protein
VFSLPLYPSMSDGATRTIAAALASGPAPAIVRHERDRR